MCCVAFSFHTNSTTLCFCTRLFYLQVSFLSRTSSCNKYEEGRKKVLEFAVVGIRMKIPLILSHVIILMLLTVRRTDTTTREKSNYKSKKKSLFFFYIEQFSLFSVVQFPNDECTSSTASTLGTCYTSSECGSRSGSASGSCAAGFGVCCVTSTSTCGATLSANISYIRNPGYPSSYTSAASGSCSVTISKASDNICQLRKGKDRK